MTARAAGGKRKGGRAPVTTQDQVKKWIVYALALLPLCLLDQYILGRIFLQLPAPLLYPLAVAAVGLWEGPFAGSLYGLGTGAVWWLGGESSLVILLLCLAGLAAGVAANNGLRPNFFGYLLLCLALLLAGDAVRCAVWMAIGAAGPGALLPVMGGEVLCSLLFAVPVYLLYRVAWRRVGGTRLA